VYIPPTAVELADCTSQEEHMTWLQLSVQGGPGSAGMLMSGGLCLGLAGATGDSALAAVGLAAPPSGLVAKSTPTPASRLVRPAPPAVGGPSRVSQDLDALTDVRVTVTATNGLASAIINEVRLYAADGIHSFPTKPSV
jgi:hypothetical protein